MPTVVENLTTRRDAIATELATWTSAIGERPNFSLDGVSVDWPAYERHLIEQLRLTNELINQLDGPVVAYSVGR